MEGKGGKWSMEHPISCGRNAAKPLYLDISPFSGLYPISNHLSSIHISHNMDKIISYIDIENCPKLWKNVTKCYKTYGKYSKIPGKIYLFRNVFYRGIIGMFSLYRPKNGGV